MSGRLAFHVNQANPNNRMPGGGVDAGFTLLPELLKKRAGYATHFLGKWHLGLGARDLLPTRRGFDTWLGFFAGAEDHWTHRRLEARHDLLDLWLDEDGTGGAPARELAGTAFGDELYTERFEALVAAHDVGTPLFVYFAYQCAHDPLQAPREFLAKYGAGVDVDVETNPEDERFRERFWSPEIFEQRWALGLKEISRINFARWGASKTKLSQRYDAFKSVDVGDDRAWRFLERNGISEKEDPTRRRAQYEAMVSYLDHSVARVEAALKARTMWESALVVFASDNGGAIGFDADSGNNWPLRGGKSLLRRVFFLPSPTAGRYSDFDGGVRTVCFVTGGALPSTMRGRNLEAHAQRVSIADWYATFAELAGVSTDDARAAAETLPPVDSRSAWPLLSGAATAGPRADQLVLSVPLKDAMPGSGGGVVFGKYKALFGNQKSAVVNGPLYPNGSRPQPLVITCGDVKANEGCLFDLDADPGETRDISRDRPDVLADAIDRFTKAAATAYNSARYAVWDNQTAISRHVLALKREYDGFWGPYVGLADREAAPYFEMPPLPWDKLKRPDLADRQRRDYAAAHGGR